MKLVTKDTIEESILNISTMKLKLDKKISSVDKDDINVETSANTESSSNEDSESNQKSKYSHYLNIYIYILIFLFFLIIILILIFFFFLHCIVEKSIYHIIRSQLTTNKDSGTE